METVRLSTHPESTRHPDTRDTHPVPDQSSILPRTGQETRALERRHHQCRAGGNHHCRRAHHRNRKLSLDPDSHHSGSGSGGTVVVLRPASVRRNVLGAPHKLGPDQGGPGGKFVLQAAGSSAVVYRQYRIPPRSPCAAEDSQLQPPALLRRCARAPESQTPDVLRQFEVRPTAYLG